MTQSDQPRVNWFLKIFGIVLLLSGLAHSAGVAHFYMTAGVPGANRVLLDVMNGKRTVFHLLSIYLIGTFSGGL